MRDLIGFANRVQHAARPERVCLGNILLSHHNDQVIEGNCRSVYGESTAISRTKRIVDIIINDLGAVHFKIPKKMRANQAAAVDKDKIEVLFANER
jgi:hypothetical protein